MIEDENHIYSFRSNYDFLRAEHI